MNHSGQAINGSSYTAIANLNYEIIQGLAIGNHAFLHSIKCRTKVPDMKKRTNTMDLKERDEPR